MRTLGTSYIIFSPLSRLHRNPQSQNTIHLISTPDAYTKPRSNFRFLSANCPRSTPFLGDQIRITLLWANGIPIIHTTTPVLHLKPRRKSLKWKGKALLTVTTLTRALRVRRLPAATVENVKERTRSKCYLLQDYLHRHHLVGVVIIGFVDTRTLARFGGVRRARLNTLRLAPRFPTQKPMVRLLSLIKQAVA